MTKRTKVSQQLKELIAKAVNAQFEGLNINSEAVSLEHPGVEEHGDYSSNIAMQLKQIADRGQQTAKMSPREIAEKIVRQLAVSRQRSENVNLIDKIEVAGPGFINFTLSKDWQTEQVRQVLLSGERYGRGTIGTGKTVVIDYSAPNIAKRFGIGHLRSTIIGQALYNLLAFQGYKVIGDNHLGDWGTQFGKLMYMISIKGKKDFTIDDLELWYVEFHKMAQENAEIEDEGRKWFKKLEDGNRQARDLWKKCIEISLAEFDRVYEMLGVKIDFAYGESFYEDIMPGVIREAKEKGIARESEGAIIIECPGIKAPLILVKKDGGTTYATRDLATLKFRQKEWNPDIIIYEVGVEQSNHFEQVFAAARMLGYINEKTQLIHTKHGLYRWAHGKMKTREGSSVKLEDILNEAIVRAGKLGSEETAKPVGIGAVKYFDLQHNIQGDIIFDWEKMFSLQGDSGPYLQYTYARARSVLRKAGKSSHSGEPKATPESLNVHNEVDSGPIQQVQGKQARMTNEELAILRWFYRFPEVVENAARNYAPNLVATYLFELAKRFNNFYNNVPILPRHSGEEPFDSAQDKLATTPESLKVPEEGDSGRGQNDELVTFRLMLVQATSIVIKNGLNLLGIEALERM